MGFVHQIKAQQMDASNTRAMMQANFIYQFAVNNNWPQDARKGKFTIGVLGNAEVFNYLKEKYASKPVGSQVLEITQVTETNMDQNYHIIFIDKSRKADLAHVMKNNKNGTSLVVTNWEGALSAGAFINFKSVDGNLRYELDEASMSSHHITPGQKILQWKVN
jgi:hypothetical protein